jgi:hypothetical protein
VKGKKAADDGETADRLVGKWAGTWTSDTRNESGHLTCTIVKRDDGKYAAEFRARFWRIFIFKSNVVLTVERGEEKWAFNGTTDLGVLAGGVYTYEGEADGKTFTCTYEAKSDEGSFEMKRKANPPASKPPARPAEPSRREAERTRRPDETPSP